MTKSRLAGLALADVLADRIAGRRPVSLVGYSMGARVIFFALEELARKRRVLQKMSTTTTNTADDGTDEASSSSSSSSSTSSSSSSSSSKTDSNETLLDSTPTCGSVDGIVFDVCLLGTPITVDRERWRAVRSVVSGRLINGYVPTDWVLGFAYRSVQLSTTVSGLAPIPVNGIENYDLSNVISGHRGYAKRMPDILDAVGFDP
jgi:hypothetical protein